MERSQRLKYEMFVRVRNFGVANRDVFPEDSAAGKKFSQLAALVASLDEQLVRRAQARAEAGRLNGPTRAAALRSMRAMASTGRRAAKGETSPHPFHMPRRSAATVVLSTARLFKEEAERRKEKFVDLGMPANFIADYENVIGELAKAVALQQDSRAARRLAAGAIDVALEQGDEVVADLDVAVPNVVGADRARLAQWSGARHKDRAPGSGGRPSSERQATPAPTAAAEVTPEETPVPTPKAVEKTPVPAAGEPLVRLAS